MEEQGRANFIPVFICDQYRSGRTEGTIEGSILISDVSGFTSLTESLFALRKRGAEQLSEILNSLFSSMIDIVHSRGGFAADFAGDAFTAVFPDDDGRNAYSAALKIRSSFPGTVPAASGDHATGIRSGIGTGTIRWNIYGSGPFTYLFSGAPVIDAASAESGACTGEIAAGPGMTGHLSDLIIEDIREGDHESSRSMTPDTVDRGIEEMFIHPDYIAAAGSPEFRDVASVFTGFVDIQDVNGLVDTVIRAGREYGGYFNLLDCGDKGNVILTLFGAPLTSGRSIARSISFAMDLQERFGERVRSGITYGRVFAGFIGSRGIRGHYTVIGDKVNTAARLMQSCNPGDVRVSDEMGRGIRDGYRLKPVQALPLKGSVRSISCFEVRGREPGLTGLLFENSFVGRVNELEMVSKLADDTLSAGRTAALLISGDAGIGKTRFAYQAQSMLPGTVLVCLKCDEILSKSLNPIETFFEDVFGTSGLEDREESSAVFDRNFECLIEGAGSTVRYHAERLRRLRHILKGFMGIHDGNGYLQLDARSRFDNTILAFLHLVRLLTGDGRLFMMIDDFQWVDPDTFSVLGDLIRQLDIDGPMICILTRPSHLGTASDLIPDDAEALGMDLRPLEEEEQLDLIEDALPCPPSAELRSAVEGKAEGNPFYIEQMIMYLLDNSLIECSKGISELKSPGVQLPGSILELIISRIDALEADIRQTVKQASVLGRRFNIRVLSRMLMGMSVEGHLKTGADARIWHRLSEIQYMFRHALIRDAVYDMQMGSQLSRMHLMAGNIIEELYGDDERMYSDLSYHFEKSGQKDRMLKYTLRAADYASDNYRNREAIEMYEKYIEHESDLRLAKRVQMKLAKVLSLIGEWCRSLSLYDDIIRYAGGHEERSVLAEALSRKGFLKHRTGHNDEALECLKMAELEYRELHGTLGLAIVYNSMGTVHIDHGRMEEAKSFFGKTLDLLEGRSPERESAEIIMFTYNNLGLIYQKMNDLEKAAECYEISMKIAEGINSKRNLAALNFGNIMYLQEKVDEAEEHYRMAMQKSEEIGDRHLVRVLLNNLAAISTARGEYEGALELYGEALTIARSLNDRKGIRLLNQNMGEIRSYMGDYSGSELYFKRAVDMAKELDDSGALGSARCKMAYMLFMKGDLDRAEGLLNDGIRSLTEASDLKGMHEFMYLMARIHHEKGCTRRLTALLDRMRSIAENRIPLSDRWYLTMVETWKEKLLGNDEKALELSGELAEHFPDTEGEAMARLIRFSITGDISEKERALAVYRDLFAGSPMEFYRKTIEFLDSRPTGDA